MAENPNIVDNFPDEEADDEFVSELYYSVVENNTEKLTQVLEAGANANQFYDDCGLFSVRKSVLHICCQKGHSDCAKILLDHGADVNYKDRWGMTPIMYSLFSQHVVLTKLILSRHYSAAWSLDVYGKTPIQVAVESGNLESVTLLLDYGVDPDYANSNGITPLMTLCLLSTDAVPLENQVNLLETLMERGADINLIDGRCKRSALQLACVKKKVPFVERLLAAGANPNTVDSIGRTPLTNLLWNNIRFTEGSTEIDPDVMTIIVLLMQKGHSFNFSSIQGSNPLAISASLRAEPLVKFFLECGANPDITFISDVTPLLISVSKKDVASVKTLLKWTCNINQKGRICRRKYVEHYWDPMELAIDLGCWDIVFLLHSAGYNLSSLDYIISGAITTNSPKSLVDDTETLNVLHDICCNPKTLFQLAVLSIWKELVTNLEMKITKLPLPTRIKQIMMPDAFLIH